MSDEIPLSSKLKDELLVCGICYSRYSTKVRLPKLLACSHTFCAPCIESYATGNTGKVQASFACPVCRRETCLGADGSSGLPNNFSLISLIEILQTQGASGAESSEQSTSPKYQSPDGSSVSSTRGLFHVSSSSSGLENDPDRCPLKSVSRNLPVSSRRSLFASPESCRGGTDCQCKVRPPAFNPDYNSDSSAGGFTNVHRLPHSPSCPLFVRQPNKVSTEPIQTPRTNNKSPTRSTSLVQLPHVATPSEQNPRDALPMSKSKTDPQCSSASDASPLRRTVLSASMPFRSRMPVRPPRRSFRRSTSELEGLKCKRKIGRFSNEPMTMNAFKKPTKVAVSDDGDIAVIDGIYMTVQLFTSTGEHISLFTVPGATCACFLGPEKVVIGTHQGIEIYSYDGTLQNNLKLESVVTVSVYKFGFIVCQPRQLTIYRASTTVYRRIKRRRYRSVFRRSIAFKSLCDVTMTTQRDIVVLDGGSGKVYVLDQDGFVLLSINPRRETCGQLLCPHSITVDRWNSVYVSDTGSRRVLKFSPQGVFSRCVLSFGLHTVPPDLQPRGLAATCDHLLVIVGGEQFAEVRVYAV